MTLCAGKEFQGAVPRSSEENISVLVVGVVPPNAVINPCALKPLGGAGEAGISGLD